MVKNWNLATKIYDALLEKGADLGNASIYIIEKVLNDNEAAQQSVQRTDGAYCPKGHLLFSDGTCPRCERVFPIGRSREPRDASLPPKEVYVNSRSSVTL
jgi:hypothetical protein